MINFSSLISSVSNTTTRNAINTALQSGQQNPRAVVEASQADNSVNTFAYDQLATTLQSLETLLDPSNNASQTAQNDTSAVAQAAQAYGSAAGIAKLLDVIPNATPGSIINTTA